MVGVLHVAVSVNYCSRVYTCELLKCDHLDFVKCGHEQV